MKVITSLAVHAALLVILVYVVKIIFGTQAAELVYYAWIVINIIGAASLMVVAYLQE
jgi:hypothetical protein